MFDNWTYTEDGQLIRPCGKPVSCVPDKSTGYLRCQVDGKKYAQHRIIFFLHKGYWPKEVDHKDRNKVNNRPDNLIDSTRSEQNHNRCTPKSSTTGIKGVNYREDHRKWYAKLTVNKVRYQRGFDTKQEAIAYRLKLEKDNGIS